MQHPTPPPPPPPIHIPLCVVWGVTMGTLGVHPYYDLV